MASHPHNSILISVLFFILYHASSFINRRFCFKHLDLIKVKEFGINSTLSLIVGHCLIFDQLNLMDESTVWKRDRKSCPDCFHSTTSVLITTTLQYTIGAGITAAAGTRLALQSLSHDGLCRDHSGNPHVMRGKALIVVTTSFSC